MKTYWMVEVCDETGAIGIWDGNLNRLALTAGATLPIGSFGNLLSKEAVPTVYKTRATASNTLKIVKSHIAKSGQQTKFDALLRQCHSSKIEHS